MPEAPQEVHEEGPFERAAVVGRVFEAADLALVRGYVLGSAPPGFQVRSRNVREFHERVLDTRDRMFRRAGFSLVVQDLGVGSEVVLEPIRLGDPGRRRALGSPVALPSPDPRLPSECPRPLRDSLEALAGRRRLRPALELRTRSEDLVLRSGGSWLGTVSLIETRGAGKVGPGTVHLARVEIRMRPASDGGFHPFLERMREAGGLVPTTSSRYEAASRAAGLPEASGPFLGETRLDPRMTAREAAFAILRRHAAQLMRREPGSRLGLDPEELHRMRVAVRRMRSAMRLYRRVLPESVSELAPELKWAGRALGPTRDLDVQLEGLAHRIATLPPTRRADLRPLENRLRRQREIARREMLAALDSNRWVRLVGRLRHRLPTVPPATRRRANRPVAAVAPRLVRRRWKKLQAAAKSLGPDRPARSYHATRILAKRMRYGLEGHRSLWGRPAKRLIDRLVAVQDVLGEHQDAVVAQSRIDDLLRERESLPAATIERLEEWRRDERRRERRLRRDFRKAYRDLRRGVDRDAPFR